MIEGMPEPENPLVVGCAQMLHLSLVNNNVFLAVDHDLADLADNLCEQSAVVLVLPSKRRFEYRKGFADSDFADRRENGFLVPEVGIKEWLGHAQILGNVVQRATAVAPLIKKVACDLHDAVGFEGHEFILEGIAPSVRGISRFFLYNRHGRTIADLERSSNSTSRAAAFPPPFIQ